MPRYKFRSVHQRKRRTPATVTITSVHRSGETVVDNRLDATPPVTTRSDPTSTRPSADITATTAVGTQLLSASFSLSKETEQVLWLQRWQQ